MVSVEEAVRVASAGKSPQYVRQLRRTATRYTSFCAERGIDPLKLESVALDEYLLARGLQRTDSDDKPKRDARDREMSAIRQVVRAAGQLSDEHPLGLGVQTRRLRDRVGPVQAVVDAYLAGAPVDRRAVTRSALTRLLTWSDEVDVDILALACIDLEVDYRPWLGRVGLSRSVRQLMCEARDFVMFTQSSAGRAAVRSAPAPRTEGARRGPIDQQLRLWHRSSR